jgi:predicted pyridoxine 5'-phosphate oxidase superfamily flavin-nucleotide-binding protein
MNTYHDGEIKVQERAGARRGADMLTGMVHDFLPPPAQRFLAEQTFAAITWLGTDGRVWITPLSGPAGFIFAVTDQMLVLDLAVARSPLLSQRAFHAEPAALVVIDFATRRRMRVNGIATSQTRTNAGKEESWLQLEVQQAYSNCPKYIQRRQPETANKDGHSADAAPLADLRQSPDLIALIEKADTFFLGTFAESGGADASHRGGKPGFVKTDGETIRWLDYPGNNMFNTFGNLELNRNASLLFVDFQSRKALSVSGKVESFEPSKHGSLASTESVFRIEEARVFAEALANNWTLLDPSPFNP